MELAVQLGVKWHDDALVFLTCGPGSSRWSRLEFDGGAVDASAGQQPSQHGFLLFQLGQEVAFVMLLRGLSFARQRLAQSCRGASFGDRLANLLDRQSSAIGLSARLS